MLPIISWLKGVIQLLHRKELSSGDYSHSIQSTATSAAFEGFASLEDICKASTLSSPSTFTRHYKIVAEAAFGQRVLQKVVAT